MRPHQLSALERIKRAIAELGGALLCDEVGLGKTYVALAVAKRYGDPIVIGPAVLRSMWKVASARARVAARFLSFESLSRGRVVVSDCDLVIIDEAHHARNTRTRRYSALSTICRNRPVLLLSATPIHNRRVDLTTLLGLFLGSRAELLDASEISRCVVRRTVQVARQLTGIPRIADTVWLDTKVDDRIPQSLLALPPPIPPREGGEADALVVRSLLRQWASSDDALIAALRRRIRRGNALSSALEEGTYPSASELESWVRGDEEVQLGFALLLAPAHAESRDLLTAIQRHNEALRILLAELVRSPLRTQLTADVLRSIRAKHPGERIVAFSQYADTIIGLYREMRFDPRVCALTGRGASIASGPITRDDALRLFAPRGSGARESKPIERIELLLTTDLLSEGVNLQDASVVVHLDMPWTPARVEQRVGRIARMGSQHLEVTSYAFAPPLAAERVLGLTSALERKEGVVAATIGVMDKLPVDLRSESVSRELSVPEASEAIRAQLLLWQERARSAENLARADVCVAAIAADVDGFIALERSPNGMDLIVANPRRVTTDPRRVIQMLRHGGGAAAPLSLDRVRDALRQLDDRCHRRRALSPADPAYTAKVRRAASRRLAAIESASVGHRRLVRLPDMERARETLSGVMDAAAERALESLLHCNMSDDEWVEAVGSLPRRTYAQSSRHDHARGTLALLLLVRR
ncbi:MAG TPA: helicase-related protein [Gemmatimonadaceae bacterium]